MAETQIEWTDATWNPVAGCSIVTAGAPLPNLGSPVAGVFRYGYKTTLDLQLRTFRLGVVRAGKRKAPRSIAGFPRS